ncbi:PHO85 cyclin CLG1 [Pseudozyma hubeiensis]|nr:PHO85 cyclin CLG1 [Pseudozyma hubeiensis]
MVYIAQPQATLPLSQGFSKDLPCDGAIYFGKENWPRSQKQPGALPSTLKQAESVAPFAVAFPTTSDSDAEVEAATASASAKPSNDDADLKSSSSVSDWCAQMVCYIWFSGIDNHEPTYSLSAASSPASRPGRLSVSSSPIASASSTAYRRHSKKLSLGSLSEAVSFSVRDLHNAVEAHARSAVDSTRSRPSASERSNDPRLLRLFPRRRFTDFVRNMLNTTQVSKSVIILALLYIHRLKSKNPGLRGQDGSEFRLFVTALMLANKFLDDHTYTNKTWSELSGLKLKDVTKMEIEFWLGLSSNIHASDADFRSWIGTLEILAERRQLALGAHEAEKVRQAALRQQGFAQPQQQQQQQLRDSAKQPALVSPVQAPGLGSVYDAPRRIAHNSRVTQPRSWSPDHLAVDTRPRSSSAATATSHLSHVYASAPAPAPASRFDFDASVQAMMNSAGYPTPAASSADSRLPAALFPTTAAQSELSTGSKRSYAQTSPLGVPQCYYSATPSPERSAKRRHMGSEDRALQAFTSGPRNYGLSPPFAQPCPRSVFEPLVSTPNTLLAPYVMQQQHAGSGGMMAKNHALAYWQLAAGYDRGILGVHMPCASDYFHWQPTQPANGEHGQMDNVEIRKPLSATMPFPTPPIDAFSPFHHQHHAHGYKPNPMHNGHHYANATAPHAAPFNNAEAHYVDPLFIRY